MNTMTINDSGASDLIVQSPLVTLEPVLLAVPLDAMTIRPYDDSTNNKVAIKLHMWWEDDDENKIFIREVIELSRSDSLFEILTHKAPFTTWHRLTIMPNNMLLYKHEGSDWFESDPDYIRRSVQNCVQQIQNKLHTSPPQQIEPPIFILKVYKTISQ
jgi:hypothetical protein